MEITKEQYGSWLDGLIGVITPFGIFPYRKYLQGERGHMITATGTVSQKDLTRLKHMNFVVSSKRKLESGFEVTVTRVTSVWPGLVDRLREEFGGLAFKDSEEGK